MKKNLGLRTLDLAKRLLDHGFHPPTVYFPLLVDEALLVEPTETETKETLDAFADAIADILREGAEDPGDRAQRAVLHAGAPARRGRRRQAPGHPPAALSPTLAACGPASRRSSPSSCWRSPRPPAADSILFVRDGNVWISTPDGSTERPLTAGGGYASPSMADDGTIVALRGNSFARLRTGRRGDRHADAGDRRRLGRGERPVRRAGLARRAEDRLLVLGPAAAVPADRARAARSRTPRSPPTPTRAA